MGTKRKTKVETRYITKYALTKGIHKIEVVVRTDGTTVQAPWSPVKVPFYGKTGVHDFPTLKEARAHVETLRARKIASLHRKIKKIENLRIKVVR